jgi:CBS domain-containing protein
MKAQDAMVRQIIHLTPQETLLDAWMLMEHFGIRHILVLEEDELVGLVSDRDVFRYGQTREEGMWVPPLPIVEVMTKDILTCHLTDSIAHVASVMYHKKIDALPVLDEDDALKGLITSSDLLLLLFSNPSGATHLSELPFFFELVDWNVYSLKLPRADDMPS